MPWPLRVLSALIGALVLLPLLGTLLLWFDPPPPLFGAAPEVAWVELLWRREAGGLVLGPLPRSLLLSGAVCALSLALGTALAWLSERADYPGRRGLVALGLVPFAVPSYLLAMGLRSGFGPTTFRGLGPAILVLTLATSPYAQLLLTAVLRRLSGTEEEAARLLGARPGRVFRSILWPRLRPAATYALLLTLLYVIADFGVVDILECEVLTWSLYQAFQDQQLERAALAGLGLTLCVAPLLVGARLLHGEVSSEQSSNQERSAARLALGARGRACAYLLHALQIGLGIVLPFGVILSWIFPSAFHARSYDLGLRELILAPLGTSLLFALATTLLVILLAIGPAWLAARARRTQSVVEFLIYFAQALPGVLVALGLLNVFLALSRLSGRPLHDTLRQSAVLLLLGLGIRFVAPAYGALKSAILRIDPRALESARLLGAGPRRRFLRIALPALRPGLASAALLVSVGVIKELPITLMTAPRGLSPLSYRLYERYGEGALTEAGLVGVTMALAALALQSLALRSGARS